MLRAGETPSACRLHAHILNTLLKDACNKNVPAIICSEGRFLMAENDQSCKSAAKALNIAIAIDKTPGSNPNFSAEDLLCDSEGYLVDTSMCSDTSASLGKLMERYAVDKIACVRLSSETTSISPTSSGETAGTSAFSPGTTTAVPVLIVFETLDFDTLMPVILESGIRQAIDAVANGADGDVDSDLMSIAFTAGSVIASISLSDQHFRTVVEAEKQSIKKDALAFYHRAGLNTDPTVDSTFEENQRMTAGSVGLIAVLAVLAACIVAAIVAYSVRRKGTSASFRRRTSQVNFGEGAVQSGKLPRFLSGSQVAWSPGTFGSETLPTKTNETPFPLDGLHTYSAAGQSMVEDKFADGGLVIERHQTGWDELERVLPPVHALEKGAALNDPNYVLPRARANSLIGNAFSPDKLFSEKRLSQKFTNQATIRNLSSIPDDYDLEQNISPTGMARSARNRSSDGIAATNSFETGALQGESSTDLFSELGAIGESRTDDVIALRRSIVGESRTDDVIALRRSLIREVSTDPMGLLNQQAQLLEAINSFEAEADALYDGRGTARSDQRRGSSSSVLLGQSRRPTKRYSIDLVTTL